MANRAEVVAALKEAVAAVDEAGVPDDLRELAFKAALASVGMGQPLKDSGNRPSVDSPKILDAGNGDADSLSRVSNKLGLDKDLVSQVFDVDEDGIHLTVRRGLLDDQQKVAQQEIAYLVVAARQAGGDEEWTPIGHVADVAHDRGVHDSNFARNVGTLDGEGLRFKGQRTKRELKMNQVGFEKASTIVNRIIESRHS
jgi:hypothetical protein